MPANEIYKGVARNPNLSLKVTFQWENILTALKMSFDLDYFHMG